METELWQCIERQANRRVGRFQRRVSAADISRATGVSPAVLSKWRSGPTLPEPKHLAALRDGMNMNYDELLQAALTDKGYLPEPTPASLEVDLAARDPE